MIQINGANGICYYVRPLFVVALSITGKLSPRDEIVEYYLNVDTADGTKVSIYCGDRESAHNEMNRIASLLET